MVTYLFTLFVISLTLSVSQSIMSNDRMLKITESERMLNEGRGPGLF
jgi:hypothetical protein